MSALLLSYNRNSCLIVPILIHWKDFLALVFSLSTDGSCCCVEVELLGRAIKDTKFYIQGSIRDVCLILTFFSAISTTKITVDLFGIGSGDYSVTILLVNSLIIEITVLDTSDSITPLAT